MDSATKIEAALVAIVGAEHVSGDAAVLDGFAGDHSYAPSLPPRFVARPANEDEVRDLVLWANGSRVPLVPVSSGPPRFHGDTVPGAPGAVMVDLGRMDAVRRIDRRNRLAVIEPGVTYSRLQPALAAEGLRLVTPLLPRADKSVVASLLERQPTLVPRYHYAFPEPLRTCGVVWGNGEVTFTGEAGYGPRSLEAQWAAGQRQVDPKGPAQTDFVRLLSGAQGTLGIVTWASVKCTLLPAVRAVLFAGSARLEPLLAACGRLQRLRLGEEVFVANPALLGALLASEVAGSRAAFEEGLPPWTLVVGLAGRALFPEERLAVQEADVRAALDDIGGPVGVHLMEALPGIQPERVVETLTGVSAEPHWRLAAKGDCRDVFFQTGLDAVPPQVDAVLALARRHGYPAADIGVYVQPQQQGVVQHVEFTFPFDPGNAAECDAVRAVNAEAPERLAAMGAYFSRPYGAWADVAYGRDGPSTSLLRTVKQVFDPNGVLNPGKLCF